MRLPRRDRACCLVSRRLVWAVGTVVALAPVRASASEVYGSARTVGEGYMVRGAGVDPWFVTRRRLVQYVSLGVRDLLPPTEPGQVWRDPEDGQLELVTALRLRHDFGTYARWAREEAGELVRAIDDRQIDLLYGHLRATSLWGWVDVTAGRQFDFTGLDFYAHDGVRVSVRSPVHVAVDTFGGFEVDGAAAFGYSRYELDGTALDDTARKRSPMFGVALRSDDVAWLDAAVAYRRTFSPDAVQAEPLVDDAGTPFGDGVDLEVVSATTAVRLLDGMLNPYIAARYNLGTGRVDNVDAGATWRLSERHDLRAFYLRTIPAFDYDSIFNAFQMTPFEDLRVVVDARWSKTWRAYARGQARLFRSAQGRTTERGVEWGYGGAVGVAHMQRYLQARLDLHALSGEGGLRTGGAATAAWRYPSTRWRFDGGVYGLYYVDDTIDARRGYSVAAQAGVGFVFWNGLTLHVVGEEMISSFLRPAPRILAVLDIDWSLRVGNR